MLDQTSPTLQKARGAARVAFEGRSEDGGGAARLSDLYQSGCAKVMLPRAHAPEPHAVFINTAGGLTGGDLVEYGVTLGPGARATAASQTAERIYRSAGGVARQRTELIVGAGAELHWLPQETILFEGGALDRRMTAHLSGDARLLALESIVLGRVAMGEHPDAVRFADRWRIHRDGRLIHAEALRLTPGLSAFRDGPGGLGDARAFATLVYLGPDAADRLAQVRAMPGAEGVRRASSAWDGRLVTRLLSADPQRLRAALCDVLTRFRGTPLPRVWTM